MRVSNMDDKEYREYLYNIYNDDSYGSHARDYLRRIRDERYEREFRSSKRKMFWFKFLFIVASICSLLMHYT